MAEKYLDSGPENYAPITSSQSGDEQSLENDGNSQSDPRRREIMSGPENFALITSSRSGHEQSLKNDGNSQSDSRRREIMSGPESNAPITFSQGGDEQSLENDGNCQSDSQRREIMSGPENYAPITSSQSGDEQSLKNDGNSQSDSSRPEIMSGPESYASITFSQGGDEQSLENNGNSQSDSRRREIMSGTESSAELPHTALQSEDQLAWEDTIEKLQIESQPGEIMSDCQDVDRKALIQVHGGNFGQAHIGTRVVNKVAHAHTYNNPVFKNVKHYHIHGYEERTDQRAKSVQQPSPHLMEYDPSPHQATFDDKAGGDRETQVGLEIYIFKYCQLREGYHVYKGVQKLLHGLVKPTKLAVKIFHVDHKDEKLFKWYVSEVEKMKSFSHSNIVRFIHCAKVIDNKLGGFYIAMELCHERTLADVNVALLRRDQKQNLFLQICDGVEYLHKKKVAHMDLKPGNILFSRDGEKAVVSDFGLSKCVDIKVRDGKTYITRSSSKYGGTEGWISAEMLQRNESKADNSGQGTEPDYFKADIFSLGLVGHHIFYGLHPFRNINHPNRPAYWEVNINEGKSIIGPQDPKSAELDVTDLFEKMFSHDPKPRPKIEKVLQHWMFWSPTKKITFLTDMYDRYFYDEEIREKVEKDGTEEQKLAYEEPNTSDAYTLASGTCSSQDQVFPKSDSFSATQASGNSEKQEERGRKEKMMRMVKVTGDRWMDTIKEIIEKTKNKSEAGNETNEKTKNESKGDDETNKKTNKKTKGNKKSNKSKLNGNCLVNGIRLIRNNITHNLGGSEDRKYATVQKWVTPFPKLWPYILEILERDFTEEDRKEYKGRNTYTGDIGGKPLLEIEEAKTDKVQRKDGDRPNHQSQRKRN